MLKPKVFLDANIFFTGAKSPNGGSGFILELAKKNHIEVITVTQVLLEAERNIRKKLNLSCLNRHYQNLLEIKPEIQLVDFITLQEINKFEKLIPLKDIPILLGAIASKSRCLITLDRKHFLDNEKLKRIKLPIEIMNPGEFLKRYFV